MFNRLVASVLAGALFLSQNQSGLAALITNQQLFGTQDHSSVARRNVNTVLARAETKRYLLTLGVDPVDVTRRVQQMSDDDIQRINDRLELAGGNDVLGIVLLLFIIFLVTDIIGATDIFPFVKCLTCK